MWQSSRPLRRRHRSSAASLCQCTGKQPLGHHSISLLVAATAVTVETGTAVAVVVVVASVAALVPALLEGAVLLAAAVVAVPAAAILAAPEEPRPTCMEGDTTAVPLSRPPRPCLLPRRLHIQHPPSPNRRTSGNALHTAVGSLCARPMRRLALRQVLLMAAVVSTRPHRRRTRCQRLAPRRTGRSVRCPRTPSRVQSTSAAWASGWQRAPPPPP